MGRYDRDEAGEDYYDDYEDDGYGQGEDVDEEEEEEGEQYAEEDPNPTKEELEFLEYRQKRKEQIRKRLKGKGAPSQNRSSDKNKLPYDNYGSFFGPSKPVIAERVIQESKSLLETQHLAPKLSSSLNISRKATGPATDRSANAANNPLSKVVNELTKVQMRKDTRDYSFLLSDDAKLPTPAKEPPPRNGSVPNSEVQSAQLLERSKQPMGNSSLLANGGLKGRKPVSTNGHLPSKVGSNKLTSASKLNMTSVDSRKKLGNHSMNGPVRSQPRPPLQPRPQARPQLQTRPQSGPPKKPKPQLGPPKKPQPGPPKKPALTIEKKASAPVAKCSTSGVRNSLPSKLQSSNPKKQLGQKRELQDHPSKAKLLPKQSAVPQRYQMNKSQKQISRHHPPRENQPKKRKHPDDDDDDGELAINEIRKMFGYNPNKYADMDEDESDMEANFEDIMREERNSAKIARMEDEEQARLIEEEERRERQARLRKQQKRR